MRQMNINKGNYEVKSHYKMYKAGKRWVVAGMATVSLLGGLLMLSTDASADNVDAVVPASESSVTTQVSAPTFTDSQVAGKDTTGQAYGSMGDQFDMKGDIANLTGKSITDSAYKSAIANINDANGLTFDSIYSGKMSSALLSIFSSEVVKYEYKSGLTSITSAVRSSLYESVGNSFSGTSHYVYTSYDYSKASYVMCRCR